MLGRKCLLVAMRNIVAMTAPSFERISKIDLCIVLSGLKVRY
jgi:hypothetical protein